VYRKPQTAWMNKKVNVQKKVFDIISVFCYIVK